MALQAEDGRLCGPSFPGQPLLCFPQDGPEFGASMTRSPLSAGGGGDLPPSRVSALPPRLWVWPLSPSATFVRRCWRPALLRGDLGSIAVSGPRAANSPSPQGAKPFAKCLPWWWRGTCRGSSLFSSQLVHLLRLLSDSRWPGKGACGKPRRGEGARRVGAWLR